MGSGEELTKTLHSHTIYINFQIKSPRIKVDCHTLQRNCDRHSLKPLNSLLLLLIQIEITPIYQRKLTHKEVNCVSFTRLYLYLMTETNKINLLLNETGPLELK